VTAITARTRLDADKPVVRLLASTCSLTPIPGQVPAHEQHTVRVPTTRADPATCVANGCNRVGLRYARLRRVKVPGRLMAVLKDL
jgi:hypothetical protein